MHTYISDKIPAQKKRSRHKISSLTKKLFVINTHGKGRISFLHCRNKVCSFTEVGLRPVLGHHYSVIEATTTALQPHLGCEQGQRRSHCRESCASSSCSLYPQMNCGISRATARCYPQCPRGLSLSTLGNHVLNHNRSFRSSRVGNEGVPHRRQRPPGSTGCQVAHQTTSLWRWPQGMM